MSRAYVWFITGTSSGFGARLVLVALERGDKVVATARTMQSMIPLKEKMEREGKAANLRLLEVDVTAGIDVLKQKVDEAARFWGRIDVLVNNAGGGFPGLLEEAGSSLVRKQFEVNVFGTIDMTMSVLPYMRVQHSGTVVVIGSRSAWRPEIAGLGPYAASKAAIHAWTETLSVEVAHFGIRVLLVEPGSFLTEGIYGAKFFADNAIEDWNGLRNAAIARFDSMPGTEKGDPVKAMRALADVVRGEGIAAGREWPSYLVLGDDAVDHIREKCNKVLRNVDEFEDISRGVNRN
ncbi:NAD(P)-binding protein [Fistulina hepatica ATCC 64428]|uniref:NAD(P)-binding protein n=1 Tax=Fistulina hepatica ATCC 64428 TaxID=1128425 RepID=A0A0D7A2U9_9AGAR|nr:NAD(P)-binding protein [Fistulina hepatica ATCC 64428]